MDAKLTLSFNKDVIAAGKTLAEQTGISLSRIVEHLIERATRQKYASIEDMPIADWIKEISEGPVSYGSRKTSRELRQEWAESHIKSTRRK